MIKIRGLIIPDADKKYVSELSRTHPFTYKNIDFRDRIPLRSLQVQHVHHTIPSLIISDAQPIIWLAGVTRLMCPARKSSSTRATDTPSLQLCPWYQGRYVMLVWVGRGRVRGLTCQFHRATAVQIGSNTTAKLGMQQKLSANKQRTNSLCVHNLTIFYCLLD